MQQEIGVTEARSRFAELVDQVRYRGDTVVLIKSGKPAAALVPIEVLEQWRRERVTRYQVVEEIRAQNADLGMSEQELMDFVNEAVKKVRGQSKDEKRS